MNKRLSSGTAILHKRFIGNDPKRVQVLEVEKQNAIIAQRLYELRTSAGLSQRDLAAKVGTTASVICRLEDSDYEGHSLNMLHRIAQALGSKIKIEFVPSTTVKERDETTIYAEFPYKHLAKLGLVKDTKIKAERFDELRQFHRVTNLCDVTLPASVHGRIGRGGSFSPIALASWLRAGEILVVDLPLEVWSRKSVASNLSELRSLTLKPSEILSHLGQLCNRIGLAFAVVTYFPNTKVNGVLRWLPGNRPLVQLSNRYKWSDVFWFSFFHEIAHLLLHESEGDFIDLQGQQETEHEEEADRWAADLLIPPDAYEEFVGAGSYSQKNVREFARYIGVSSGIVVGRLQHDGFIRRDQLNSFRTQLKVVIG